MAAKMKPCSRCGTPTEEHLKIEPGMRLALQGTVDPSQIPDSACPKCYDELTRSVSKGMKLRMEAQAREQNRAVLWKSRVNLIKQARSLMNQKAYSEAAVSYEKYLRVLEIVYNKKPGQLDPGIFNNSKRSKEMTIITSVYWDLLRIYDMSPRYGDRQRKAAAKLAQFVKFSTIYPDIVKRAEAFVRSAKHPDIIREFLRSSGGMRGKCFIATAVYGDDPYAREVLLLRRYRDTVLRKSPSGRALVYCYYRISPPIAGVIRQSPFLQHRLKPWLRYCAERLSQPQKPF